VFPNFGALALHYLQGLPAKAFDLAVSKEEAMQLLALHSGPLPPLRFSNLTGLIGFPSFHTVMVVLTVNAVWEIPIAGMLACNILVLVSVPADGGHHFVDIAGGTLVAIVSIGAVIHCKVGLFPFPREPWRGSIRASKIQRKTRLFGVFLRQFGAGLCEETKQRKPSLKNEFSTA
jgi:hypothetical protein